MDIRFNFKDNFFNYKQVDKEKISKLSFLLTNVEGDFLNFGFLRNSLKNQGYIISRNNKDNNTENNRDNNIDDIDNFNNFNSYYKIIDFIELEGVELKNVIYEGFKVRRIFKSKFVDDLTINLDEKNNYKKDNNSDKNNIEDNNENNKINNESLDLENIQDTFYLCPTGGIIYHIENFDGIIKLNVDMREINDFSTIGRYYNSYKKDDILYLEYTKKNELETNEEYKLYLGIKAVNFDYKIIGQWKNIEYEYSKKRSGIYSLYIYDFLRININNKSKKFYIGAGLSEKEVKSQIEILEKYEGELVPIDRKLYDKITKLPEFELPLLENISVSYRLSNNAMYKFLKQNIADKKILGYVAGFPWFTQIWLRDEIIALRVLINNRDYLLAKERIFYYLDLIKNNDGLLPRLLIKNSLNSPDAVFWLSKRIGDLIYNLEKYGELHYILDEVDLNKIYDVLFFSFGKIIEKYWNPKRELLKVNDGDPWMDTIHVEFPLDIQVLLLEFVSNLAFLSKILNKDNSERFLDFESSLKEKIRREYYNNYNLYQEPNSKLITANVFLTYYIYPDLFLKSEWELIFENSLKVLESKGLISTISRKDPNFVGIYSGEDNKSYHNGDSWYWINNIAAIVLNDINEVKFRNIISKIISNSTNDILTMGCIGFGSELSSATKLCAEGSLAQLWSSSTYIEMVDSIFKRKFK